MVCIKIFNNSAEDKLLRYTCYKIQDNNIFAIIIINRTNKIYILKNSFVDSTSYFVDKNIEQMRKRSKICKRFDEYGFSYNILKSNFEVKNLNEAMSFIYAKNISFESCDSSIIKLEYDLDMAKKELANYCTNIFTLKN